MYVTTLLSEQYFMFKKKTYRISLGAGERKMKCANVSTLVSFM